MILRGVDPGRHSQARFALGWLVDGPLALKGHVVSRQVEQLQADDLANLQANGLRQASPGQARNERRPGICRTKWKQAPTGRDRPRFNPTRIVHPSPRHVSGKAPETRPDTTPCDDAPPASRCRPGPARRSTGSRKMSHSHLPIRNPGKPVPVPSSISKDCPLPCRRRKFFSVK